MLSYALQPKGSAVYLAAGVSLALVAIIFDALAYKRLGGKFEGLAEGNSSQRHFWFADGGICAVRHAVVNDWPCADAVQRCRLFQRWGVLVLLRREYLFHETPLNG